MPRLTTGCRTRAARPAGRDARGEHRSTPARCTGRRRRRTAPRGPRRAAGARRRWPARGGEPREPDDVRGRTRRHEEAAARAGGDWRGARTRQRVGGSAHAPRWMTASQISVSAERPSRRSPRLAAERVEQVGLVHQVQRARGLARVRRRARRRRAGIVAQPARTARRSARASPPARRRSGRRRRRPRDRAQQRPVLLVDGDGGLDGGPDRRRAVPDPRPRPSALGPRNSPSIASRPARMSRSARSSKCR